MAISNAQAQAAYQNARDALDSIARSARASEAQKKTARRERDSLDLDFIGKNVAQIEARTAQFHTFIEAMDKVVKTMTADALLRGMKGLTEVLGVAKDFVGEDED